MPRQSSLLLHASSLVATLLVALGGCASAPPSAVNQGPIAFNGFSISPPAGTGWVQAKRDDDSVIFGKSGGTRTHTLIALVSRDSGVDPALAGFGAYATDPNVFVAYVKYATEHGNPPGGRTRIVAHEVVFDARFGYCAREYVKKEDSGSPVAPTILIEEDWLYVCLQPGTTGVIVQIFFSERGLAGEADPALETVRDGFFGGFAFTNAQALLSSSTGQGPSVAAAASTEPTSTPLEPAAGSVVFVVKESLRSAVRRAASQFQPPLDFDIAGDSIPETAGIMIELSFSSSVDRTSQTNNQTGAAIGGLPTILLGAITPWACHVVHTLDATVTRAHGEPAATYSVQQKETKIGTMLACPDVTEPGKSVATQMVAELLPKIAADGVLPEGARKCPSP